MPKTPRTSGEIEHIKEKILNTAMDILFKEGFEALTMRKIAVKTKMTAANIYNYFSNKEEISLSIQTRGFALLYDQFENIDKTVNNPVSKIKQIIQAYIKFGLDRANQYEIMFIRNMPKHSDYVGTNLEQAAFKAKQTALKLAQLGGEVIIKATKDNCHKNIKDAQYRTLQIWTALHGVVSPMNSRMLPEVDEDTTMVIEKIIDDLLRPFTLTSLGTITKIDQEG